MADWHDIIQHHDNVEKVFCSVDLSQVSLEEKKGSDDGGNDKVTALY